MRTHQQHCFHCGTTLHATNRIQVEVAGESQQVCCPGCQSVVEALDAHLFYQTVKETETYETH